MGFGWRGDLEGRAARLCCYRSIFRRICHVWGIVDDELVPGIIGCGFDKLSDSSQMFYNRFLVVNRDLIYFSVRIKTSILND